MGQRHQIYLKLPYDIEHPTMQVGLTEKIDIIGLHHQWFYGTLPLRQLKQFIDFVDKGISERNFAFGSSHQYTDHATEALHALYSLNIQDGAYSPVDCLTHKSVKNPYSVDNNDGVTLIDLSNLENPKYAFMFLENMDSTTALTPLSAQQYIREYYNPSVYPTLGWGESSITDMEKNIMYLLEAIETNERFQVLSLKEVKKQFPAFYVGVNHF